MSNRNIDAHSWEFTQRIVRIWHNRLVRKHFKDIGSDTQTNTGRSTLKSSVIIRDADSALETLVKLVFFWLYLKGIDNLSSIPFSWAVQPQADRAQLAIVYRPVSSRNKSGNLTTYIPHYNGNTKPKIPAYAKGNWWARATLKDNSHIVVYAKTRGEAERVIKVLLGYVERKYLSDSSQPRYGYLSHKPFRQIKVKPYRADYYSQGTKSVNGTLKPKWRYYFTD